MSQVSFTIWRYASAVLLAIVLSNAITLSLVFAGYPLLGLILAAPVGLTVGYLVGRRST